MIFNILGNENNYKQKIRDLNAENEILRKANQNYSKKCDEYKELISKYQRILDDLIQVLSNN